MNYKIMSFARCVAMSVCMAPFTINCASLVTTTPSMQRSKSNYERVPLLEKSSVSSPDQCPKIMLPVHNFVAPLGDTIEQYFVQVGNSSFGRKMNGYLTSFAKMLNENAVPHKSAKD